MAKGYQSPTTAKRGEWHWSEVGEVPHQMLFASWFWQIDLLVWFNGDCLWVNYTGGETRLEAVKSGFLLGATFFSAFFSWLESESGQRRTKRWTMSKSMHIWERAIWYIYLMFVCSLAHSSCHEIVNSQLRVSRFSCVDCDSIHRIEHGGVTGFEQVCEEGPLSKFAKIDFAFIAWTK